jgi:hypothetical protein
MVIGPFLVICYILLASWPYLQRKASYFLLVRNIVGLVVITFESVIALSSKRNVFLTFIQKRARLIFGTISSRHGVVAPENIVINDVGITSKSITTRSEFLKKKSSTNFIELI